MLLKFCNRYPLFFTIMLFFCVFEVPGTKVLHLLSQVFKAVFLICSILIITHNRFNQKRFLIFVTAFNLLVCFSALYFTGSLGDSYASLYVDFIFITMGMYILRKRPQAFIMGGIVVLSVFLILNYYTIIQGISYSKDHGVYFIGIKTRMTEMVLSLLLMMSIYVFYFKGRNIKLITLAAIAVVCTILSSLSLGAATSIICIVLFTVSVFTQKEYLFKVRLPIYIMVCAFVLSFPFLELQKYIFGYLNSFFENVSLDKDSESMSGRDLIWAQAILQISSSPWFGAGNPMVDFSYWDWKDNCLSHNQFLDTLLKSGIAGLSLFSIGVGTIIKKMKYDKCTYFCFVVIILMFVEFITEVISLSWLWIPIMTMLVIEGNDKKEKKLYHNCRHRR